MFIFKIIFVFFIIFLSNITFAEDTVVGNTDTAFKEKMKEEDRVSEMLYSFSAHKPFYLLPITYNSTPSKGSLVDLSEVNYLEVKFQFSFKFNIIKSFLNDYLSLDFAYTNLSFWQLYNSRNSAPFRETNHEPDLFLEYHPNKVSNIKAKNTIYRLGFVHQSNGQNVPESRSWNRIYTQGIFDLKYLITSLKIWHRLSEGKKTSPLTSAGDDNPDILNYLGNFELQLNQKFASHTLTLLLRNNLKKDNKGSIELSWSFPLNRNYKGYLQFYNGYGESLIDYNVAVERIGVGVLLADWL
jgi:phospholipase A1/A2